ncbi:MAG: methylated-DNA--[protein]-cysteine S-methyltransferase, partial [Propionibacteriaceae bacterium]|nr:methylated-DNA--[protein]-cysteine S-methyltransferase [Propionibacteriaceae bacterium]
GEYLNRVRARHARELLDAGTPITDVAFALGFEALGAFYRMFKQETGQTPQQYRDRRSTTTFAECESPIGKLVAVAAAGSLVRLLLPTDSATDIGVPGSGGVLDEAIGQLDEYFNAARREFDLPISPRGTAFQRSVWDALRRIGYGRTASYAAIAAQVGSPKAARAVGQANNRNPIPVVIPCHRVIGSGGSLVGFRGGVDAKRWLLEHELSHA